MENIQIKEGSIFYSSWGYDQTNIDFYQVVKATAKTVWLRKLNAKVEEKGFMSGDAIPVVNSFYDDEILRRRVSDYGWGPRVSIESYASASLWDGKAKTCSWYA